MSTNDAGQIDIFKDHVAKYEKHSEHLETLEWKKPGSSTYAIWYVRQYGTLMVFGDCYEAIYQWSYERDISLQWMAECDEGYFVSKCRASSHGRSSYTWDSQAAKASMKEYFAEYDNEAIDDEERDIRNREKEAFEDQYGWSALGEDKYTWVEWLRGNACAVFGDCWAESIVCGFGGVLDPSLPLHLEGLKAAFSFLGKEA